MATERLGTLSSSTLFHFTNSLAHLESILRNNFRPNFSLEDWSHVVSEGERFAFPLVSFCDIPLSQTRAHMGYYGRYAIGLSKEWARETGISPVSYVYQGAATADVAGEIFKATADMDDGESDHALWDRVFRLLEFLKPYEGPLARGGTTHDSVRFYDEREWRFVPEIDDCEPHYFGLSEAKFSDDATRQEANKLIQGRCALEFSPSDVKYLIVSTEDEILPFMRLVEDLKGSKYSLDEVRKLTTRIISAEQIEQDF